MEFRAEGLICGTRTGLRLRLGTGAMVLLLGAGAAQAQDAPAAGDTIETVVVTARKHAEPIQQTPIAITAFTSADLAMRNVTNLSNVAAYTPNLVFDQGTGNTGSSNTAQIFIRGIGQTDFLFTTEPGVGIYIDGVYLPRAIGSLMDMVDVQQIEVLKGPQGTLFGQNSVGGAINITTREPAPDFGGQGSVTVGNYARHDFQGTVNVPLGDDLLTSLSLISRNEDGYVKRPFDRTTEGDIDMLGGRAQVLWTPGQSFDLRLIADFTQRWEHAIPDTAIGVNPASPVLGLWNALVAPFAGGPYTMASISSNPDIDNGTGPNLSDLTVWGVSATATWHLDAVTLKAITAYRHQDAAFAIDTDHSALDYLNQSVADIQQQVSEEVQASGTALDGRFNYVFGVMYFHEDGRDAYNLDLAPGLFQALEALPPGIIPGLGGAGNPANVSLDLDELISTRISSNSYSGYAHGEYKITDRLTASAGLRYTYDVKHLAESLQQLQSNTHDYSVGPHDSWDALTPQFGLQYQWTPDIMTYVSAARGFKAGGFNGRASTAFAADIPFDPEYVWTYEAGVKTEWLDNRLLLNGAAFYSDYSNLQLTTVTSDPAGSIQAIVQNAGKARIDGFELEGTAIPLDGWNVDFGLGYLDAAYTRLSPTVTGVTLGDRLVKTPKWSLTIGSDYTFGMAWGDLTLRADYSYRSKVENVAGNDPLLAQNGYGLFSANATIRPEGAFWSLVLFGTNLADERYIANGLSGLDSVGTADVTYGRPREFGARLNVDF